MSTPIGRIDSGGGPPEDGKMEARVSALEQTMAEVRERLARIEATMATKDDVTALIKWMVGLAIGISVAAITIITFVLNYAAPPRAPAPQVVLAPPTVIVVPPAAPK